MHLPLFVQQSLWFDRCARSPAVKNDESSFPRHFCSTAVRAARSMLAVSMPCTWLPAFLQPQTLICPMAVAPDDLEPKQKQQANGVCGCPRLTTCHPQSPVVTVGMEVAV